ncbi:arylsulfatase [Rhodophyticola sp. CCM32]|uniref:arylsulfatase n=1 Tax=Rhodophyticola sp. CCM32 TaxID=2916397 RepID=UPI00107FCE44|nr:arylsulfatase [Rhodophyticola sp. CCM32]QBY01388.1 arylsulfatase [Rhodophyticola sp. CCM32]
MTDFPGKIGRTVDESTPWWPGAADSLPPNIVTILFDDTGWADFGCFGSEIRTPHIDALAGDGLRFNSFHVTPLCSPTRACLLTGKNHHHVGMRCLADTDTGFPNGRGTVRSDVPLLPELLRDQGFGTYMVGKWHLTPAQEVTPAGPHKNWPVSRGFDRYYGFLGGCTDHYTPELIQDNHSIDPPETEDYHLSEDLADRAITYLRDHTAFRRTSPFFLNLCFGATHAPIQVAKEFIDPYVPVFEKGWDQTREDRLARQKEMGLVPQDTDLVPRNPEVPDWDSLDADARRLYTRLQAAYAGFLEHSDVQIGRLVAELKRLDLFDNTIILVMSDNGASREGGDHGAVDCNAPYSGMPESVAEQIKRIDDIGGPNGPAHYPQGWAMAGNTPFRRYKQFVELGGVRSPLVVSWPLGLDAQGGGIRDQFLHAIDVAPTLLDIIGQRDAAPFDGASFRSALTDADTQAPRNTQYWEMFGRRAVYHDGWKAVSEHDKGDDYAADTWRLYDTRSDFSECHDLAAAHPDRLAALQDIWWQEAEANEVMPLDDRTLEDILVFRQPNGLMSQQSITFYSGQGHVPQISMVTATERSMDITAALVPRYGGAEGVLVSSGDDLGGYSLYIKEGALHFEHVWSRTRIIVSAALPEVFQTCGVRISVAGDKTAVATLVADGIELESGSIPRVSGHTSFWGLDVGRDAARQVSQAYTGPNAFPDEALDKVNITFRSPIDHAHLAATGVACE